MVDSLVVLHQSKTIRLVDAHRKVGAMLDGSHNAYSE